MPERRTDPWTPEERAAAVALRRAGLSLECVAAKVGRSARGSLREILAAAGCAPDRRDDLPANEAEVRRLHAEGMNVSQIAARLGKARQIVGNWCARLGLGDRAALAEDPAREGRILLYRSRAEAGLPLFDADARADEPPPAPRRCRGESHRCYHEAAC